MVAPTIRTPSISFEIVGGAEGFPVANIVSNGGSGGDRGVWGVLAARRAKGFPVANIVSNGGSREGWVTTHISSAQPTPFFD